MARPHNPRGGRPRRVHGEATTKVTVAVTAPELSAIDTARGDADRSTFIRGAVAVAVEKLPKNEQEPPTAPACPGRETT